MVGRPWLWRLFRGPLRAQFDRLAGGWEARQGPAALAPLVAALERLDAVPRTALDLGTGTGKAARLVAERFPACEVVGADLSPAMVEEARRLLPESLAGRVRFEVADASSLPFPAASFDLVVLLNMIPFFPELARVAKPRAVLVIASMFGSETPIYTPPETLRAKLEPLGFNGFELVRAGPGEALLARSGNGG